MCLRGVIDAPRNRKLSRLESVALMGTLVPDGHSCNGAGLSLSHSDDSKHVGRIDAHWAIEGCSFVG